MKKGYKFTDKKQSPMGISSSIIGIIAVGLIIYGINVSFKADGYGGSIIGILGSISMVLSAVGLVLGLRSFKNDDVFYLFSWFGSIINSISLIFTLSMILIGI